jgi:2-keto-3-deoxy-6-phosphogluconate aldolase
MGSALITGKIIQEKAWKSLTEKVKTTIEIIARLKNKPSGR